LLPECGPDSSPGKTSCNVWSSHEGNDRVSFIRFVDEKFILLTFILRRCAGICGTIEGIWK
jgi:hypothetical protein